jgi:hypothetical protein
MFDVRRSTFDVGVWCLKLPWCLGIGTWNFRRRRVLGYWDLELAPKASLLPALNFQPSPSQEAAILNGERLGSTSAMACDGGDLVIGLARWRTIKTETKMGFWNLSAEQLSLGRLGLA